jgi:hypothetical protein
MYGKRTERIDMPRQIRIDPALARAIKDSAEANDRPIAGEILHRLKNSFKEDLGESRQEKSQV